MIRKEYEYYAFISYSRADEKWAKWVQHKLETYRFPIAIRREHKALPKKIFPVFRDKTDLSSGELRAQLEKQLDDSEYLIVICSPNSAASPWVNDEVAYFQKSGRNENIIPLIIDGEPHAQDKSRECFCPALGVGNELLGVSIAELGKKNALIRMISSIMHLKYDQLVMRERKRTLRNRVIASIAGVAALVMAVGLAWYNSPHSKYYWSYVYRNEIPEGLMEMTSSERQKASVSYKIVTQRGEGGSVRGGEFGGEYDCAKS